MGATCYKIQSANFKFYLHFSTRLSKSDLKLGNDSLCTQTSYFAYMLCAYQSRVSIRWVEF